MEFAARDLIALLDVLNIPSVQMLGYSMGGRLALFTALTYPARVKALILESASPGLTTTEQRAARVRNDEALAVRIEHEGIAWFASYWESLPLFATQPETVRTALRSVRLSNQPRGLANSLRGMGTGVQPSMWERLGKFQCPTLLVAGALDPKFVEIAQRMAAAIPSAQLCIVPDAGHAVHQEQPAKYVQKVCNHSAGFKASTP
jgi:2-succinyl-6-hydroxy-2,4-cyclohexadiene-1-carboxylate synthase